MRNPQQPFLDTLAPIVTPRADWASVIVDQADRLGLKWDLRPGTVTAPTITDEGNNPTGNAVAVIVDGDDSVCYCTPLAGISSVGARVMVMKVPPAGNFIIGSPATQSGASQLIYRVLSTSTAAVNNIPNTSTSIPGFDVTLPIVGGFDWEVEAFFDFNVVTGGATAVFAQLTGPNGADGALPIFGIPTTGLRATVGQVWAGTTTAGGSASFTWVTQKAAALGNVNLVLARALIKVYQ